MKNHRASERCKKPCNLLLVRLRLKLTWNDYLIRNNVFRTGWNAIFHHLIPRIILKYYRNWISFIISENSDASHSQSKNKYAINSCKILSVIWLTSKIEQNQFDIVSRGGDTEKCTFALCQYSWKKKLQLDHHMFSWRALSLLRKIQSHHYSECEIFGWSAFIQCHSNFVS